MERFAVRTVNSMASVALENVSKFFPARHGEIRAVSNLSFEVDDGELAVLLGPSGCGKTTTLRLIAGLERASAGTVRIDGNSVNHVAPGDRNVALVFQDHALYPHMTVFANVAFGLKVRGVRKDDIRRRVHETARRVGVENLLERKPAALSGGERQRVALARAIVRRPAVFLLDEPLSHLDAPLRRRLRSELKRLHRELRITTLYVTHDQEEAMTLGDRLIVIHDGRVQQIGSPMEVYREPANRFVAAFIGNPQMNFLEGTLEIDDGAAFFRCGTVRLALAPAHTELAKSFNGRNVLLGIRPEHVTMISARNSSAPSGGFPEMKGWQDRTEFPAMLSELSVRLVEPLGDRTCIHAGSDAMDDLVALGEPGVALKPEEQATAVFDLSAAHFFEPGDDGRRLNPK